MGCENEKLWIFCFVILSASEVSIKLKCILNSVYISPVAQ